MIEIRSFRDLLRLFFIFRREFAWAVVVTVIVAVLGAFLLPSRYESTARLLVKPGRENSTLPIEISNRSTLFSPSTQRDPIVDEEKLITGRGVVREVARQYLDEMARYRPVGFWKTVKFYVGKGVSAVLEGLRTVLQAVGIVEAQTPEERLARKLGKSVTVEHDSGSAVIDMRFVWGDAEVARKVLDTWVQAYLHERTKALGRRGLYDFYEQETRKVAAQIADLKKQLHGRLAKLDSVGIAQRIKDLTVQINRLQDDRIDLTNELAGIDGFLTAARARLKHEQPEVVTEREISLNPTQLDLKRQLNTLEVERAQLLRTYLPDSPQVAELDTSIAGIKDLIAKEQERLERAQTRKPNPLASSLLQQIQDAELRQQQLRTKLDEGARQMANLSRTRQQMLDNEPLLNQLTMQLESAEKTYALYADNLEKARIDRDLDENLISNIAVIEAATFNPAQVFPKSLMLLLLALPAGLAVGLLTIYVCYLLDQRIHDEGRLEARFGLPVWGSLRDLGTPPGKPDSAFVAGLYRIYSRIPVEQVESRGYTLALTSGQAGEGVSFVIEQLRALLGERGQKVRAGTEEAAQPGEIALLDASALQSNIEAFIKLRQADQICLVIAARNSTIPAVENTLSILTTAFKPADGLILNRRRLEVPARVLRFFYR